MGIKKFVVASICLITLLCSGDLYAQTRIRFARGRTSASLAGTLRPGGTRRYVLGATRDQQLSGNISSRNDCVKFTEGDSTSLTLTTRRGDNWITVTNDCRRPASFTMTVSINY
ncbi:MAG TPA: hypothetical protein VEV84_01255 [Pyrinomonadaceae bacterium]|jgi:hypothetical protein|nr:hypothetical protein [Pyrinomonadaceae bacterium]